MTETKSFPSERIKIRCSQCHARLCDKLQMDKGWVLHFKKARTNIYTNEMVLTCASCNTSHHITNTKGIVQSLRHSYISDNYDSRVQAQTSNLADVG